MCSSMLYVQLYVLCAALCYMFSSILSVQLCYMFSSMLYVQLYVLCAALCSMFREVVCLLVPGTEGYCSNDLRSNPSKPHACCHDTAIVDSSRFPWRPKQTLVVMHNGWLLHMLCPHLLLCHVTLHVNVRTRVRTTGFMKHGWYITYLSRNS